jgi:hypothetical protein
MVTVNGESMRMPDACERFGLSLDCVRTIASRESLSHDAVVNRLLGSRRRQRLTFETA